jgi:hypothetical protein
MIPSLCKYRRFVKEVVSGKGSRVLGFIRHLPAFALQKDPRPLLLARPF